MNNRIISNRIAFVLLLILPNIAWPQGTVTFVSNLGATSTGSAAVGSDSWFAADFTTGTNSGGYTLNSIDLAMTDGSGNPSDFTVMIYTGVDVLGGTFPGGNIATLSGSANPTVGGIYSYAPVSSLTLAPSTFYFIIVTAGTTEADGSYGWSVTDTGSFGYNGYHWGGEIFFAQSSNGLNWSYTSGTYGQFSLDATAAPESGVMGLLAAGGLVFGWRRWKTRSV
jgi:hypothetical protein